MPTKPTSADRPPVIAIMGHIDHGKSTLLDYIRSTNIVAKEAGGITQHVSAYEASHKDQHGVERKITFLDTPGHAAFETMRVRGAAIADIAVLVVSAEEGVKAQTLEALKSIESASIPYIVAMTKTDRPNANVERTKQNLSENGIYVESYGGKIPSVAVSAKTGEGVSDLLDMMLLVAELEEFKGDPSAPAEGYVLEANLDQKIGTSVTLVVKNGTLKQGDFVVVGKTMAKVKKLEDFLGKTAASLTFSSPARVIGFAEIPAVGAEFKAFADKKSAEKAAAGYAPDAPAQAAGLAAGEAQVEVPVVVKTDVVGTREAVEKELAKLSSDLISLRLVHAGVGTITENDVKTAAASENSIVLGFNVKVDQKAKDLAERFSIALQTFDIIYKLGEWMEEEVERRRPRQRVETTVGKAKILKLFSQVKDRQVVGGVVSEGTIFKGREVKIIRRDHEIGRGKIVELQEQKVKAASVEAGSQFGAMVESRAMIAEGDVIEVFDVVES